MNVPVFIDISLEEQVCDYFYIFSIKSYNADKISLNPFLKNKKIQADWYGLFQAVGALGELSDKSDFHCLHGTVLAKKYTNYYYSIVKNL